MRVRAALAAALLAAAPLRADPQPDDGFLYPGQPGAEEAAAYLERRARQLEAIPGAAPRWSREELDLVAWMAGRWRVAFRTFTPEGATTTATGRARVRLAPGARWLTISVESPPERYREIHLGFDPRTSLWTLHDVTAPTRQVFGTRQARGWSDGRLPFGLATETIAGVASTRRETIVRLDDNRFRMVTEVRMPSGQFVAIDDLLFSRLA